MTDPERVFADRLGGLVRQGLDLRFGVGLPGAAAAPPEVLAVLLEVRGRLDRLESLLLESLRLRDGARQARTAAEAEAGEAWDQQAAAGSPALLSKAGDYTGPRERYAQYNIATLDQQRQSQRAARVAAAAEGAYEQLRVLHRGLDGLRQDLVTALRAVQFESSIERTTT